MGDPLRVAVVGAGVGGLALAQGLRAAGVDVGVYERDPSPQHRRQGYRIHISGVGERALSELLPAAVHRRVVETATVPGDLVAGFDSRLTQLFEQVFPVTDPEAVTAVDRYAFRRALMTGLDDALHFGHDLRAHHETPDGRVELRFADGRTAAADVLVGADGVDSRIRARLLPGFRVVDIGARCIYGKLPLTGDVRDRVPPAFLRGFCSISHHGGPSAAFAPVLFREPPAEYGDYLMVVFLGTTETLGHGDDELFTMAPERLWEIAVDGTRDWHPTVHDLLAAADASAAFPITLRTCTRIEPWPTGRVTLLGDAIHPMTPAAGAGANTALRDAAALTRALTEAQAGKAPLVDALAGYEAEMIDVAAGVVEESLVNAERMLGVAVPRS